MIARECRSSSFKRSVCPISSSKLLVSIMSTKRGELIAPRFRWILASVQPKDKAVDEEKTSSEVQNGTSDGYLK